MLSQLTSNPLQQSSPEDCESRTCEICGAIIPRMYISFLKRYVLPACKCEAEREDKRVAQQERDHRKRNMERTFKHNLMNEDLVHARFSTFKPRPGTEMMYRECHKFAERFEDRTTGLLGYGNPGNGKSHLFVSIHHNVDAQGFVSLFLEVQRLFNIAEDAKKYSSKVSLNDIINAAIQCDLLTLDELGAGKLTQEQFTDVLFPIINGRQGKVTNYTTNLDLDELREWLAVDKYGKPLDHKGRLIDRILGSCDILKNSGTSKRQEDALRRLEGSA